MKTPVWATLAHLANRALLAAVLIGVCTGGSCQVVDEPDELITDPLELLARMDERGETMQTARFRSIIEYYGGDTRGANFRNLVLVRRPEDLHVQVLSPFGQSLTTMTSNGNELSLYDLEAQRFYHGESTPDNIARLLPFYLTGADVVRVLLGGAPYDLFGGESSDYQLSWDGDRGAYLLEVPLSIAEGSLRLWVRDGDWVLSRAERANGDGELVFELRLGEPEDLDGFLMPRQLRFLLYGDIEVDMSMELESVEVNVDLPDSLFRLQAPAGVEQIDL